MILTVNSDYFLKPVNRQPVDLCNSEVLCFLCGTDWIIKYYLDELRLQSANKKVDEYKQLAWEIK
jgi:NADH:ubiquinone oxidoreductase subunit E